MSTGRTYLYRLFDRHGDLLYIGVTKNPRARFSAHRRQSVWASRVKRRRLQVFPTLDAALAAEAAAIHAERPRFNVVHNRDGQPPRPHPVNDARCWFIVRCYDQSGLLLRIGHTRSLETWWRNQKQSVNSWPMAEVARIRMVGPYERPVMRRLVREARRSEQVAS